jgi:hypothetical protein
MAVDWSSLPSDLLRRLGDHHLAAGDIDYYMDMRSVCHNWRSAIPKPPPLGAGADLRFRPRHWVMLDENEPTDGRRLFVNVSTGRFLRRRVPMLHDHHLLAASSGLLVLRGKSSPPAATYVLNPFTGLALLCAPHFHEEEDEGMMTVYFVADPGSELREVRFPHHSEDRLMYCVHSMVAHAGHVYVVASEGCVFRILDAWERPSFGYGELITRMAFGEGMYLVESAGELLLVRLQQFGGAAEVFRVHGESKVVQRVHSIGRRALFLGFTNGLSVDADKFPSIDPNCIYLRGTKISEILDILRTTYRYDLSNGGKREDVTDDLDVRPFASVVGPVSLARVLLDYCNLLANCRTPSDPYYSLLI